MNSIQEYKKEILVNSQEDSLKEDSLKNHSNKAVKAPPTHQLENIYLSLGIALFHQDRLEEALGYFKKSIEIDDSFIAGYQWIDFTEDRRKKTSQAV